MIEVEAKVWLDAKNRDSSEVLEKLQKNCSFVGELIKSDWYFSRGEDEKEIFRLRQEDSLYIVTYKERLVQKGIEMNQEIEFSVDDKDAFIQFSEKLGYKISFYKNKKTQQFTNDGYTFELSFVEKLGYFLEIEKLCQDNVNLMHEQELLMTQFQKLGFSQNDLEPKKYLQLLTEKK